MMDGGRKFSVKADKFNITGEIYYPESKHELYPALIICHGIPAAVPVPGDNGYPMLAKKFAAAGFITCIFNFRGCGESEGNLDLLDWTRDLERVITFLTGLAGVDQRRISLMGFSGGAAASAYVAARDERVSALVLCACPARFSIGGLGQSPEGFLDQCRRVGTVRDSGFPASIDEWAAHFQQVSPLDYIDRIAPRPLLIIHGDEDETIPPEHAAQLYAGAKDPRELVMIAGGKHRLRIDGKAMETALDWLKRVNHID